MKIRTSRFGDLEVNEKDIINFNEGILGFENLKKFFIVDPGDQTLILWLQSINDPKMAFPIIEPRIYKPHFIVKLLPAEMLSLSIGSINEASVYTILTIPSDPPEMTANLKAPIIINNKTNLARQIVLQDNKLELQLKMYKNLRSYISSFVSDDSRRTKIDTSKTMDNSSVQSQEESTLNSTRRPSDLSI